MGLSWILTLELSAIDAPLQNLNSEEIPSPDGVFALLLLTAGTETRKLMILPEFRGLFGENFEIRVILVFHEDDLVESLAVYHLLHEFGVGGSVFGDLENAILGRVLAHFKLWLEI